MGGRRQRGGHRAKVEKEKRETQETETDEKHRQRGWGRVGERPEGGVWLWEGPLLLLLFCAWYGVPAQHSCSVMGSKCESGILTDPIHCPAVQDPRTDVSNVTFQDRVPVFGL